MKYNFQIKCVLLAVCLHGLIQCHAGVSGDDDIQETNPIVFTLQSGTGYQTIHGFGASDAWACQFVGANWPDDKKNQIADWLFSTDVDADGNPKGIGLSVWRFNIGGGSAEQGTASDIEDKWRRAECFLSADQSYDWSKQAGQRWFLQAAKARNVEDFIAFVNSPPVSLTTNGKAYSSDASQYNLPEQNYPAYAAFLTNVLAHFQSDEGITFQYVSPFNEPQWDWTSAGQEGTPAQNDEIAAFVRVLNPSLAGQGISTKIEVPEAGQIDYLIETSNKEGRGNQVEDFFNPTSENYVGDLSQLALKVAGHSYFSTWDFDRMKSVRQQLVQKIEAVNPDLEYWMTEYCLLEDNDDIKGSGKDLSMSPALYMARVIHADLTEANACSWQWWTAISAYDYKDGLVYIDKDENNGAYSDSKMMWALGNYARFIRPGMQRIAVTADSDDSSNLDFSAYTTEDGSRQVFVIQNYKSYSVSFQLKSSGESVRQLKTYLTSQSADDNLRLAVEGTSNDTLSIPGNSVLTVVLDK